MEPVLADRAGERANHVVLPDQFRRGLRTVPAVERLVLRDLSCLVVRHALPQLRPDM